MRTPNEELVHAWFLRQRETFRRTHPNAGNEELYRYFMDELINNPTMLCMTAEIVARQQHPELKLQLSQLTPQ